MCTSRMRSAYPGPRHTHVDIIGQFAQRTSPIARQRDDWHAKIWACFAAIKTLAEWPLVLMARSTSPRLPKASVCREKSMLEAVVVGNARHGAWGRTGHGPKRVSGLRGISPAQFFREVHGNAAESSAHESTL